MRANASGPSAWIWLRGHGAPLLLLAVAAWQLYHVGTDGWSSWRGGGFGMYAGYHPNHMEAWVWLSGEDEPIRIVRDARAPAPLAPAVRHCLVRANRACLEGVRRRLQPAVRVRKIQIWSLEFDPSSATLRRTLVLESGPESSP